MGDAYTLTSTSRKVIKLTIAVNTPPRRDWLVYVDCTCDELEACAMHLLLGMHRNS